jgi:hypothetical protein
MADEKKLIQTVSLDELLTISELGYENENENKEKMESALQIYAKDLVPNKVDSIAYFIDQEGFAIKSEEQYIEDLKAKLKRRTNAFEKIKKYFGGVLFYHGYNTENRLNGNIAGIYSSYTYKQKDDLDRTSIPEQFKVDVVDVRITAGIYKDLFENVENPPPVLKMERDTLVDMKGLKESLIQQINGLEEGEREQNEEYIMGTYYNKNIHLKVGKSNKKGKKIDDRVRND